MTDIFTGTGAPLTSDAWTRATGALGLHETYLWTVLAVESRGFGYQPDRRPKILYERHVFHARTGGRFSASHPDISNEDPGGYLGGAAEYLRLKRAMLLNREAALDSASWGLGQVMGFNAESLGFAGAGAMVEAFKGSEDAQLAGCVSFITERPELHDALRARRWSRVAFFYNGRNYARLGYHEKLRKAYDDFDSGRVKLPSIEIRSAQARLTYLGYNPRGVDGIEGQGTRRAAAAFQAAYNARKPREALPTDGGLDQGTRTALRREAGV